MQQLVPSRQTAPPRFWYPFPLVDRNARTYRVSFRVAEEATWDHRFHDVNGREIAPDELVLAPLDYRFIQSSCDHAVGSRAIRLMTAANNNGAAPFAPADAAATPA
jgi:hypothetical protein